MDRRAFIKIVGAVSASTFALATGRITPKTSGNKIDLDLVNDHMEALERLLDKGESQYVI